MFRLNASRFGNFGQVGLRESCCLFFLWPSHTAYFCCFFYALCLSAAAITSGHCSLWRLGPTAPPPLLPPHPVHMSVHAYERSNVYVTSHARHAMRMGWSEASLSPGEPLVWQGGRRKRSEGAREEEGSGEEEAAGRYEGEESIFSERVNQTKNGEIKKKRKENVCFVCPSHN